MDDLGVTIIFGNTQNESLQPVNRWWFLEIAPFFFDEKHEKKNEPTSGVNYPYSGRAFLPTLEGENEPTKFPLKKGTNDSQGKAKNVFLSPSWAVAVRFWGA